MIIASIYKKSTGQIIKTVSCPKSLITLQYNIDTESYIEGSYNDSKYYIENNIPILIPEPSNEYVIFNYDTKQWYDPRTIETEWDVIRNKRDNLLQTSDWTQLPDVPITTKEAWATYRQALRDITNQSDPFNITWPTVPGV